MNKTTSPSVTITKMNGGTTTVGGIKKIITKSASDVIIAKEKQQSGVFKKNTPTSSPLIIKAKPNEGQVRIIDKTDVVMQSGIVRVLANSGPKTGVTRLTQKMGQQSPNIQTKTIIRSNVSPITKQNVQQHVQSVQRLSKSPGKSFKIKCQRVI